MDTHLQRPLPVEPLHDRVHLGEQKSSLGDVRRVRGWEVDLHSSNERHAGRNVLHLLLVLAHHRVELHTRGSLEEWAS